MNGELKSILQEIAICNDGDSWGTCLHWHFTVCDILTFERDCEATPAAWHFKPSPMGIANDPDDYASQALAEVNEATLERLGWLLFHWAKLLKRAGKSY